MKILFAGPSLYGADVDLSGLVARPPAGFGDVDAAAREGAVAIGLIDGFFGGQAAVWHKEILYALSLGITVFGASSMGALRAAECAPFGMIPVGQIARAYTDGSLDDDAAVALVHVPPEFGSMPLSEPLVDCLATIERMEEKRVIEAHEADALQTSARAAFFANRTVEAILSGSGLSEDRCAALFKAYEDCRVRLKQQDALELVRHLRQAPEERSSVPPGFAFNSSPMWLRLHPAAS
jgi:hypothetical protein